MGSMKGASRNRGIVESFPLVTSVRGVSDEQGCSQYPEKCASIYLPEAGQIYKHVGETNGLSLDVTWRCHDYLRSLIWNYSLRDSIDKIVWEVCRMNHEHRQSSLWAESSSLGVSIHYFRYYKGELHHVYLF